MTGKAGVVHVFTGDVGIDANETAARFVGHGVISVYSAWLPPAWFWLLLLLYFRGSVRKIAAKSQPLAFTAIAFCFAFLTVWLMPGSRTRFLLNVYPCAAICVGVALDCACAVIEQGKTEREETGPAAVRNDLLRFTRLIAGLAFLAALGIVGISAYASWMKADIGLAMSPPGAFFFGIASALLGFGILGNRRQVSRKSYATSLFCVAAFFGLLYNLPVINVMNRSSERTDLAFQELYDKRIIPDHRTLVSLDECPHLINYLHFLQHHVTVAKVTLEEIQEMRKTNDVYFVSNSEKFPLEYTVIAKLPLRRYRRDNGDNQAVFGKIPSEKNP